MFESEAAYWVFSTLAQVLAVMVGFMFIGFRYHINFWSNINLDTVKESFEWAGEDKVFYALTGAYLADSVRRESRNILFLMIMGAVGIILDVMALAYMNWHFLFFTFFISIVVICFIIIQLVRLYSNNLKNGEDLLMDLKMDKKSKSKALRIYKLPKKEYEKEWNILYERMMKRY